MKKISFTFILLVILFLNHVSGQWALNGINIYNTNTGNVGIGSNTPGSLLYVSKSMIEPTITIRNLGGSGGATYTMIDDASGANWKFKATLNGGFKIRDHANELDVITIEPNSFANALYIKSSNNIGIGTTTPDNSALIDMSSNTKGFLVPRMDLMELNAIVAPADGLLVFCTDCGANSDGAMVIYIADTWKSLSFLDCITGFPSAPTSGTHSPSDTEIIWNWNPVTDAIGYKWNTTNNHATAVDMGNSTTKTETGLNSNTSYTRYIWAYNNCGNSTVTVLTSLTSGGNESWDCGDPILINHIAGNIAPVNKTVTYGTILTNLTGSDKCWITQNLGADHQAISVNDATETSAGWYWQFNRMQGYMHDGTNRTPNNSWVASINENSNWISANDPCSTEIGTGWRIPSQSELANVDQWSDWNGPWNSVLKLHAAGALSYSSGSLIDRGVQGIWWSTLQAGNTLGWYMRINSGECLLAGNEKSLAVSIRCLKD